MKKEDFLNLYSKYTEEIEQIKAAAHALHASVNQHYDKIHPYGYHLDMVADAALRFGHLVCESEADILPLFFGAYFHDSIEDARQTYNDVLLTARQYMIEEQAKMATEIVYALTNDKGRDRAERAGERYYQGIRETPYAPFVKMADRLANFTYSFTHSHEGNEHMKGVYAKELPHFLRSIDTHSNDPRFQVPKDMIDAVMILIEKLNEY